MTDVRQVLHEVMLPRFISCLRKDAVVFEIGKGAYDYKQFIPTLKTLDRDGSKKPDLEIDIEQDNDLLCDAIMCIGVTEECENPFELIKGVHRLLDAKGIVLFGIALTANPIYDKDYWRFTFNGATKLVEPYFKILEQMMVSNKYVFFIAEKK